ncbi:hypothetical protein ML5_2878 [Micromonospora sp. L5]|uniref:hypothetical protein n=1 Tax=Micromonospora TaxID=1873 RepID=UPI0001C47738|nr:hypothetical protein [Micromonospora sp. L5]ADU08396.1 hypothetical protein ML5_2878 [Micromonospora sp. L5]
MTSFENGTRRTIDELVTLHQVEPDLHEVYTEGRSDAGVIEWFIQRSQAQAVVYAVSDRVEVDFDVCQYGVDFGEKGKVVGVAQRLSELGVNDGFTCIVDADYWHVLEEGPVNSGNLLVTDHTDLNIYCFDEKVVQKFLLVCLRAPAQLKARSLLSAITPLLRALFVLRWLLRRELPGTQLVQRIERRIRTARDSTLSLDAAKLLNDSLGASPDPSARTIDKQRVLTEYAALLGTLTSEDPRKCINGHDFVRFLCFYLGEFHAELFRGDRKGLKDAATAKLALLGCLDVHDLAEASLFKALLTRLDERGSQPDHRVRQRVGSDSTDRTEANI